MVSYLVEVIAFIVFIMRGNLLNFLEYFFGRRIDWLFNIPTIIVFWYLIISLFLGGLPVPEETLLPIYYVLVYHSHIVIALLFFMLAAAATAEQFGNSIGTTMFLVYNGIGFYMHQVFTKYREDLNPWNDMVEVFSKVVVEEES